MIGGERQPVKREPLWGGAAGGGRARPTGATGGSRVLACRRVREHPSRRWERTMRHGTRGIGLCGLVLYMLVLTGVGPARSVADGPTLTLADDFQTGAGSVWRLQRVRADALRSVPDPAGQDRNVLAITLRTGD